MSNLTGQQLGHYRLLRKLGSGGFADVYQAEHIYLNTQVAVKVLTANLARGGDMQDFLNEAQFIARLDHPHIVRVRDFGVEKAVPYLVMDFAPNGTLRQRYPKGTRLDLSYVMTYVKQLASALQYAHTQHMIHRDVKPENILLGSNDKLLLGDFGAALVTRTSQQLNPQTIIGTPLYMAPEQIDGIPGPASDQYALGIVVYEWLCGYCPFEGAGIWYRHLSEPPPSLCARVPGISYALEQAVMKALAKRPEQRFGSIQSFADALERASKLVQPSPMFLRGDASPYGSPVGGSAETIVAPPPAPQQPRPQLVAPSLPTTPPELPVTIAAIPHFQSRPPLATPEPRPSRRTLLRSAVGLAAFGAFAGTLAVALTHQGTTGPKVSASGSEPTETKLIYTYTGHKDAVFTAAWSPDGRSIASAGGNTQTRVGDKGVQVWNASNGQRVYTYPGHSQLVRKVAWSRDGSRIASASEDGTVQVWDAMTGNNHVTYPHAIDQADVAANHNELVMTLAWSPDGTRIASASNDKTVRVWYAHSGEEISPLSPYKKHLEPVVSLAWSHDGKFIASGSRDGVVQVWNATTGTELHSLSYNVRVGAFAWSPDSTRIAIGYYNTDNGADDSVRIWDINTGNNEQIIPGAFGDLVYAIDWSLDGKYIAAGYHKGEVKIWSAHTQKQLLNFPAHSQPVMGVQWSPQDSHYLVTCGFDQRVKIWMLS
jgi:serine/threonine protein kinase